MSHVAGFTVAHDVSARDWQMGKNGKQWLLGKTFDTFCPLGPALVTKNSISGVEAAKPFCLPVSPVLVEMMRLPQGSFPSHLLQEQLPTSF